LAKTAKNVLLFWPKQNSFKTVLFQLCADFYLLANLFRNTLKKMAVDRHISTNGTTPGASSDNGVGLWFVPATRANCLHAIKYGIDRCDGNRSRTL